MNIEQQRESLPPLCSLDLPLSALAGYQDAQRGCTENPYPADSPHRAEWATGYDRSVSEGTAQWPRGFWFHLQGRIQAFLREGGPQRSVPEAEADFILWLMREPKRGDCLDHGRYVGAMCPDCSVRT